MAKADLPAAPAATAAPVDLRALVRTAIRRADLKQGYLAALARVQPSQLSSALHGHAALNLAWLETWPPEFWDVYLPLLRAAKERTTEALRQQRRERLLQLLLEVA